MIQILLSALFAAAAVLSFAVILDAWRRHGGTFLAIRSALQGCATTREARYILVTTQIRSVTKSAQQFSPTFRFAGRYRVLRAA